VVFLLIEFPLRQQKLCVFYFPLCLIFVDTCCTHFIFKSQFRFSIGIRAGTLHCKDLFPECDPYLFVTSIFLLHLFIMDFSQLSEENHDIELSKVFAKFDKLISPKELKKVKQEKESLIVQLSESHALIDSLRSENTMLFNIIDKLENKLKESEDLLKNFSSDNLKSMLCIYSDISNKPASIVDMSTSTSHASDSKIDSIKPVIVDTACLENSCLTNHVMPKSKDTGTQAHGKFVPTCHNCGNIGHIRPNCYLLRSHKPWIKQDALRKSEAEDSSSSKYVPPHRRHIKGK
jgi:hypothetical protein